jgi:hypothetical protein
VSDAKDHSHHLLPSFRTSSFPMMPCWSLSSSRPAAKYNLGNGHRRDCNSTTMLGHIVACRAFHTKLRPFRPTRLCSYANLLVLYVLLFPKQLLASNQVSTMKCPTASEFMSVLQNVVIILSTAYSIKSCGWYRKCRWYNTKYPINRHVIVNATLL